MNNLKCPFCQQELKIAGEHTTIMSCFNGDCKGSGLYGEKEFWQELIRTKKQLETAVSALKYIQDGNLGFSPAMDFAEKALAEITATLESKNDKTRNRCTY